MAESDTYRIGVQIVADTAAGAEETVSDLEHIKGSLGGTGEAAGEAEKGIARMIEEAGTVREAQRIAQGFFDVFLGGGRTIEGTAEIMRFFIATAADLNPIFATLAVLGSSIAVIAGRQGEHNEKMEEGKKAAEDLEQSLSTLAGAISDTRKQEFEDLLTAQASIIKGDRDQLTALQANTEEIKKQVDATKALQRAKEAYNDAQLGVQIAELERARQIDLSVAKPGAERDAVNERYDNLELQAREKRARDKADAAVTAAQQAVDQAKADAADKAKDAQRAEQTLADLKRQQQGLIAQLNRAQDESANAKNFLASEGIHVTRGEDGKPTGTTATDRRGQTIDPVAELENKIAAQQANANFIRESLRKNQYQSQDVPSAQKELAGLDATIEKATNYLAAIRNAIAESDAYDDATKGKDSLAAKVAEMDQQIKSQQDEIAKTRAAAGIAAGSQVQTAQTNLQTAQQERAKLDPEQQMAEAAQAEKQRKERAQRQLTDEQAQHAAEESELGRQLKLPTTPANERPLLQKALDVDRSEDAKAEADFKLKYNEIDQAQHDEATTKAGNLVPEAERTEPVISREEYNALLYQLTQLKARVDQRPDHKELEPVLKSIEALGDPIKEVPLLQDLLAQRVMETVQATGETHAQMVNNNAATKKRLDDLAAAVGILQRQVKSNGNGNNH